MWTFMEPLMGEVLDAITPETVEDWAAAITDISVWYNTLLYHYSFYE